MDGISRVTAVVIGMLVVAVLTGLVTITFGSGHDDERYRAFEEVWSTESILAMIGVMIWWAETKRGAADRFAAAIRGGMLVVALYALAIFLLFVFIPPERCGDEGCNNLEVIFLFIGVVFLAIALTIALAIALFFSKVLPAASAAVKRRR